MAVFTHYWTKNAVDWTEAAIIDGISAPALDHTAANQFRVRGVSPGDRVYVVNYLSGRLRVIGRMVVGSVVDIAEAERLLSYEPWEASDHLIAEAGGGPIAFDAWLTDAEVGAIEYVDARGSIVGPARRKDGDIDPQTFRGVREITPGTGALLGQVLARTGP